MASLVGPNGMPPMGSFPGPLGSKRRRMRSGGNVSTLSNNNTHFNNPRPSVDLGPRCGGYGRRQHE